MGDSLGMGCNQRRLLEEVRVLVATEGKWGDQCGCPEEKGRNLGDRQE